MPVAELASLTWEEVGALDKSRAIAILPVGAIEAHGPHLPLTTDVIIAEAMARAGAGRLAAGGHSVVILPVLSYTAAPFAAGFPGTVSASPGAVTALVVDLGRSIRRQGFPILAVANSHLDPAHLESLEQAVGQLRGEGGLKVAFANLTRKPWALRLGEEFRSGACHAGQFETSIVMAARPDLVREDKRRGLADNPTSIGQAIREGKRSFEEAGGARGYFGFPAAASAEEGHLTIEVLGAILQESVMAGTAS
jgi:creatinine amidohydrolase